MNKEKHKQNMKRWKDANKEKIKEYNKNYNNANKEKIKEQHNIWNEANKEKIKEQSKNRIKQRYYNEPLFKLSHSLRALLFDSFKRHNSKKPKRTEDILGCSITEFKQYIESKFEPWMNWENKGSRKVIEPNQYWDIDHIIPLSSAKTEEDIVKLNHYTNLQPLCSYHNRFIKKAK